MTPQKTPPIQVMREAFVEANLVDFPEHVFNQVGMLQRIGDLFETFEDHVQKPHETGEKTADIFKSCLEDSETLRDLYSHLDAEIARRS